MAWAHAMLDPPAIRRKGDVMVPSFAGGSSFRRIDDDLEPFVCRLSIDGQTFLRVRPEALIRLAQDAFRDVNFFLRSQRLAEIAAILEAPEASDGDRLVARLVLDNAVLAARGEFPLCQDTGTATVFGWKGERVLTFGDDAALFTEGIARTYAAENLRHSLLLPQSMLEEVNSRSNLPALIEIAACPGDDYRLLFVAKGGGSANRAQLFQVAPALLRADRLEAFLIERLRALGTAACPPYRIAIAIGGLSPESCLAHAKLASCGVFDGQPELSMSCGAMDDRLVRPFRDLELEARLLRATRQFGIGAQLPGCFFALDVRVLRLPRHSASLPIGLNISCLADRQIWGRIGADGVWLEELEAHPERFLPRASPGSGAVSPAPPPIRVDLRKPMDEIRAVLGQYPVGTRFSLHGPLVVARDLAHAKLRALLESGQEVPEAFLRHPIYYAGPAKAPPGRPCGAFGPTTAGRMDADLDFFQSRGAALVTLAKGNRSAAAREACRRHGGFYLGTIGGTAALVAHDCIRSSRVLAFEALGMEALFLIEVEDLLAFTILDDKGNDLYAPLQVS